jgi:ADP-glucose pyrophosphorylase
MPGAEVGERAIVVRSIIAPGVRVENGAELIDVVVGANGARSDLWAASTKRLREER